MVGGECGISKVGVSVSVESVELWLTVGVVLVVVVASWVEDGGDGADWLVWLMSLWLFGLDDSG